MKAVLISIQPYWVFLIIAKTMGWNIEKEKTVEVRKNYPKAETWDKTVKIYCSKDKKSFAKIPKEYQPLMQQFLGKVIGEFVCDYIEDFKEFEYGIDALHRHIKLNACLSYREIYDYLGFAKCGYGWHISDLVIYAKPKELSEFRPNCNHANYCTECKNYNFSTKDCRRITRSPQSWCYVERLGEG